MKKASHHHFFVCVLQSPMLSCDPLADHMMPHVLSTLIRFNTLLVVLIFCHKMSIQNSYVQHTILTGFSLEPLTWKRKKCYKPKSHIKWNNNICPNTVHIWIDKVCKSGCKLPLRTLTVISIVTPSSLSMWTSNPFPHPRSTKLCFCFRSLASRSSFHTICQISHKF